MTARAVTLRRRQGILRQRHWALAQLDGDLSEPLLAAGHPRKPNRSMGYHCVKSSQNEKRKRQMPKHSQLRPLWSGASSNWHCHTSEIVAVCCMVSAVGPLGGVKPKQRALASGFIKHVHLFSHCWFYYRVMVLLVLGCSSFF